MTERTYTLGAIIGPKPDEELRYIGADDESDTWQYALGWPTPEEIADAKRLGYRYARLTATEDKSDD